MGRWLDKALMLYKINQFLVSLWRMRLQEAIYLVGGQNPLHSLR